MRRTRNLSARGTFVPAVIDLRRLALVRTVGPGSAHVDQTCDDLATAPGGPRLFAVYRTPAGGDLNGVPQVENNRKDDDGQYNKKKQNAITSLA